MQETIETIFEALNYYRQEVEKKMLGFEETIDKLEAENEALVKIVAQSAHEEHCYAENWWDSSCDCGLMDLVLQLSPRLQNAIDDERKSWESDVPLKGEEKP